MGSQPSLLAHSAVEQLADALLEILERIGILCQNTELLQALSNWGAKVDEAHERAWFPRPLVEAFVAGLNQASRAPGRFLIDSQSFTPPLAPPPLPRLGTQVAQFFYDDWAQERRPGSRDDLVRLIKLGDSLHRADGVGHSLLLRDVPPLLEPLEAAMLLAEYAHLPQPAFAWNVRQVDYLVEMGEILGISGWYNLGATCFSHPLRFDKDVADRFVHQARTGRPTGLTGMQVSGATTPVTVAGYIAVSAAEFVATWIAARALNPDVPLRGSMWGGTLDMGTGAVSYCHQDAMLRAFATAEFLLRWCGQDVAVGGGEYCDARTPGRYAALEKAYKAMTIAAYTGRHPIVGEGMLENGQTISPLQLLLDRELSQGVQVLTAEFPVTPESIALDTILDVGLGLDKTYLEAEHTLHHHRESLWQPEIAGRLGWRNPADEEAILARARGRVEHLIAAYEKPDVDPRKLAQMRQVVERARREMLADA